MVAWMGGVVQMYRGYRAYRACLVDAHELSSTCVDPVWANGASLCGPKGRHTGDFRGRPAGPAECDRV